MDAITPPGNIVRVDIKLDEDFSDTFTLIDPGTKQALDLSATTLDMYVRPDYDHPTLIHRLSSDITRGGEIVLVDAAHGQVSFAMARAVVAAVFPQGAWKQFLTATTGGAVQEVWRGPFNAFPGTTTG